MSSFEFVWGIEVATAMPSSCSLLEFYSVVVSKLLDDIMRYIQISIWQRMYITYGMCLGNSFVEWMDWFPGFRSKKIKNRKKIFWFCQQRLCTAGCGLRSVQSMNRILNLQVFFFRCKFNQFRIQDPSHITCTHVRVYHTLSASPLKNSKK